MEKRNADDKDSCICIETRPGRGNYAFSKQGRMRRNAAVSGAFGDSDYRDPCIKDNVLIDSAYVSGNLKIKGFGLLATDST